MSDKKYANINGLNWEVAYPFCAGCPELVIGGICAWEGNGCRYPDKRIIRPVSFHQAFFELAKKSFPRKAIEELIDELGSCVKDFDVYVGEKKGGKNE